MEALLVLVIVAALLALGYAAFNFIGIKKMDEGTVQGTYTPLFYP